MDAKLGVLDMVEFPYLRMSVTDLGFMGIPPFSGTVTECSEKLCKAGGDVEFLVEEPRPSVGKVDHGIGLELDGSLAVLVTVANVVGEVLGMRRESFWPTPCGKIFLVPSGRSM